MESISLYLTRVLSLIGKRGASTLHFTVGNPPVLRVHGEFIQLSDEPIVGKPLLDEMIATYLDDQQKEALKEKKILITTLQFGGNLRFKMTVFYQKNLPSVTFHYISAEIRPLSDYNFPSQILNFINSRSGLLIIAGPYGSGRSNTSAAFIEEFNTKKSKHIVTLEDPIEHIFIGKKSIIEQRQVGLDIENIQQGLDYCLKEDVDLVYLPENREVLESGLGMVMELASGNALIIIEMNAVSTLGVIERILFYLERHFSKEAARHIFSEVLYGVIVQRLIPRRGGGMVLAKEIAIGNAAIKSFVRDGKINQVETVLQTSRQEGMTYMPKVLEELIQSGEVRQEDTF